MVVAGGTNGPAGLGGGQPESSIRPPEPGIYRKPRAGRYSSGRPLPDGAISPSAARRARIGGSSFIDARSAARRCAVIGRTRGRRYKIEGRRRPPTCACSSPEGAQRAEIFDPRRKAEDVGPIRRVLNSPPQVDPGTVPGRGGYMRPVSGEQARRILRWPRRPRASAHSHSIVQAVSTYSRKPR